MHEAKYRVLVHIAEPMVDMVQKCFRCGEVLTDYRNSSWPEGDPPPLGWSAGRFVGVIQFADGSKMNPSQSLAMDHDANAFDEVPCHA